MNSKTAGTPGAFGATNDPNAPKKSEKREIVPRKLMPPPEVKKKMIVDDKVREVRNPIVRFIKKFFGEGI